MHNTFLKQFQILNWNLSRRFRLVTKYSPKRHRTDDKISLCLCICDIRYNNLNRNADDKALTGICT